MEVMRIIPVGWLRSQDEREGGIPTGGPDFFQPILQQTALLVETGPDQSNQPVIPKMERVTISARTVFAIASLSAITPSKSIINAPTVPVPGKILASHV